MVSHHSLSIENEASVQGPTCICPATLRSITRVSALAPGSQGWGEMRPSPAALWALAEPHPASSPGGGPAHCRERTSHLAAVRLTEVTGLPACSRGWELSILPTVGRSSCAQTWRIFGIRCVIKGTLRSSPGASKAELPLKDPPDPTTFKHLIHPRSFPSIWLNEVAEFLLAMTQNITQTFILPKFIN